MSRRKNETNSKVQGGKFKNANAVARPCNLGVALLINSPNGTNVVRLIRDPRVASASSSAMQARIIRNQAILDRKLDELKEAKEHGKMLEKRLKEFSEKHNFKNIQDLNMEELLSLKSKLEALRESVNQQRAELQASAETQCSSSLSILSENKNDKK